jgi:NAD(P)-dependent dehydrogenase (short-subunit alcohol dehydrogenase family)
MTVARCRRVRPSRYFISVKASSIIVVRTRLTHASNQLFGNLLDNPLRFPFAARAIPLGDSKGSAQDDESSCLRKGGGRVIACDLRNADVIADLTTSAGRAELVDRVTRLSGGRIDGIVANAGGGAAETSLSLNFFGAVATLEGLRPLLATSPAPRAVAVSSIASFSPVDPGLVEACLSLDERRAVAAAREFATKTAPLDAMSAAQGLKVGLDLYSNAKHALNCWCRRAAVKPQWAGAGIPLNVVAARC